MTTTDAHPTDVLVPRVLWAQRHNRVYVTIEVFGVKDEKITLTPTALEFSGTRSEDNAKFAVQLEFYANIVPEESQKSVTGRNVAFILQKEQEDLPYWPRLIKDTKKMHYIALDFSKWCDEDEEGGDDKGAEDFANFGGMGGMPGMGGMGGMPGMDFANFDPSQFANMGQDEDEEDSLYNDDDEEEKEEHEKEEGNAQ